MPIDHFRTVLSVALFARVCRKPNWGGNLSDNYTPTDELTEDQKYDFFQKNGYSATGDDGAIFTKTAEWTNKTAGEAKITLQYQAPEYSDPTVAVFVFGECSYHGFSADIAQKQILELLQHYDQVDCITTHHPEKNIPNSGLSVAQFIDASYMVSESFFANDTSNQNKIYSFLHQYDNQFYHGIHATGALALKYLQEYLKTTTPTAIYVSLDNNIAFQNDTDKTEQKYVAQLLSGMSYADLNDLDPYSVFDIDMDTMAQIGEYQKEGRYYICRAITTQAMTAQEKPFALDVVGYDSNEMGSVFLAYYSVATFAPYYFANYNQELQGYFDSGTTNFKYYQDFLQEAPNAQPFIDYSQTFGSQDVSFNTHSLTITDTISDDFEFSNSDISIAVYDANNELVQQPAGITWAAEGQTIQIYAEEIESNTRIVVDIACRHNGSLASETDDYVETNVGDATAKTTGETAILLPSPKLYSRPIVLPMTGGNGRKCIYTVAWLFAVLTALLSAAKHRKY